jgi:ferric-dicitrate binding protein FerR (iron transport regulator)
VHKKLDVLMEQQDIDTLIAKVLSGEAGQEELLQLEDWKKASKENQSYFEESKSIFERISSLKEEVPVNTEQAWKKLESRLNTHEGRVIPLFREKGILQAAASIVLLVSLGFVLNWWFNQANEENVELATTREAQEKTLPDGSKVVLDKNSSLSYTLTKKKVRQVKLKGIAHFEVIHNNEKPFVIEVNEVLIKDLGTSFEVKALPESDVVEVSVEEGEVQFYTASNTGLRLVKGEKATYNKQSKEFLKGSPSTRAKNLDRLARRFNFENTPLSEVIEELNAVYNSDIRLENSRIGSCRLSVSFDNEQLDVLLSVIAETLNLRLKQQDSTIILQGEACPQ